MNKFISSAWIGLGILFISGCVNPEPMNQNIVTRYQDAMSQYGPQARVDAASSLLKPPVNSSIPPLKVIKDSGKTYVRLTLEETVMRALANNLDIRVVSYDPSIAREDIMKAAAEFDYTLVGAWDYQNKFNRNNFVMQRNPITGQITSFSGNEFITRTFSAGVKEKTITGLQQSLAWTMTRASDNSVGVKIKNPDYEDTLVYQATQPLLRDAWPDFNLAKMHIAQVNYKINIAVFRQKVEETMTDVISTYWALVETRREVQIQQSLLDRTVETYQRTLKRKNLDATDVQIKQAEAAVAQRRAVLIRANKNVLDTQDKLVRLLSDSQINLLDTFELIPVTPPLTTLVEYSVADQLLTGLAHNATLEQARLAIDAQAITVRVAQNQELPRLDLLGSVGIEGLSAHEPAATEQMFGGHYISYSAGAQAEYPIGNRAAIAETARQRFAYQKSIAQMQTTADQVGQLIKERIRQIQTSYEEMLDQALAVDAAKAQLEALYETEMTRGRLTPEFLQLKLQSQESLADSERAYVQAIANYNATMVDLARATGTLLQIHNIQIALPSVAENKKWPAELLQPSTATTSPYWPPQTSQPEGPGFPTGTTAPGTMSTTAPANGTSREPTPKP
jgi:outer membrane protein